MKKIYSIVLIVTMLGLNACGTVFTGRLPFSGSLPVKERGRINTTIALVDGAFILFAGIGLAFLAIDAATGGLYHREFDYKVDNKTADEIYSDLKENYSYSDLMKNDVINAYNNDKNNDLKDAIVCKAPGSRTICARLI